MIIISSLVFVTQGRGRHFQVVWFRLFCNRSRNNLNSPEVMGKAL